MAAPADPLALLPAWLPWVAPVRVLVGAFVTCWLTTTLTWLVFRPWRHHAEHWAIGARLRWPFRLALALSTWFSVFLCALLPMLRYGPLAPHVGPPLMAGAVIMGMLGVSLAGAPFRGRMPGAGDPLGTLTWIWASRGHLLLMVLLGVVAPPEPGLALALCVLGALLAGVLWSRGFGLASVRLLGRTRPPTPRLQSLVDGVSASLQVPVGSVAILRWRKANAFAFPASGALGYTEGILETLDDEALEAVTAHELGHLAESAPVRRRRMLLVLMFTPLVATRAIVAWGGPLPAAALFVGLVLLSSRASRWIRDREHDADAVSHDHVEDGAVHARALEEIYRHNDVPAVLGRQRTHPELYDRLIAAEAEPDWPRPERPSTWRSRAWAFTIVGLLATGAVFEAVGLRLLAGTHPPSHPLSLVLDGLHGGDEWTLMEHAWEREDAKQWEEAAVFWEAAWRIEPDNGDLLLAMSMVHARRGDCKRAREFLEAPYETPPWEGAQEAARVSLAQCQQYGATVPIGMP